MAFTTLFKICFSGLGGAFIEATAVSPEGRIGYGCTGIWNDDHIEGLKKITKIFREHNCRREYNWHMQVEKQVF